MFSKLDIFFEKFFRYGITFCVLLMSSLMVLQIFTRYLLRRPLLWIPEFLVMLLVWMVWLGAAYQIRSKAHMNMDLILQKLQQKTRLFVVIFLDLLIIIFLIVFMFRANYLVKITQNTFFTSLSISHSYMYFSALFGSFFMLIYQMVDFFQNITKIKELNTKKGVIK